MTLLDAAYALDEIAAGRLPERPRLLTGALSLDNWCRTNDASRDLRDAAAGLEAMATGTNLNLDDAGKARAATLAAAVRQTIGPRHG